MTRRPTVFALLAVGGLLALVASAQPWWRATGNATDIALRGTEVTGGLSQALGVVALAGVLLALSLQARGRRVLAGLLGLTGLGMVVVGGLRLRPSADVVRTRVRHVTLADQFALDGTAWPEVYAVAGVLVLAGSALLAVGAGRWPRRTPRFDRTTPAAASPVPVDLNADPARAWQTLDAGGDPTVAPGGDTPGADPDARPGDRQDTMDAKHTPSSRPDRRNEDS